MEPGLRRDHSVILAHLTEALVDIVNTIWIMLLVDDAAKDILPTRQQLDDLLLLEYILLDIVLLKSTVKKVSHGPC